MKKRLHAVAGTLLSLSMAGQAFALGAASYSSELISAKSLGMGGVGVAGATDDISDSYTNPAGLTALKGTQVTIGGTYVNASPSFTNAGSQASPGLPVGAVSGARATSVFIPNFGISSQFLDGKLAAGLAVVDPYGLETHFDGDSPVRYAATDARLRIIDITPSVAYKVCSGFSIGVGGDYYDTIDGALDHAINESALNTKLSGTPTSSPDGSSALAATGDGWGYHVGATLQPNEHHKIGLVYHSNVKMSLSGNVQLAGLTGASALVFGGQTFNAAATAPVFIPQNVQLGYAYMPNKKWTIEADAAWYDWYDARQLGITYSGLTTAQNSVLQSGNPQQFDPRKTLNFGLGANYIKDDVWQFRGGAYYQGASLPESAFDPAFADIPRYGLTVGASYAITPAVGVDVAYNAVIFHTRSINQNQIAQGQPGFYGSFDNFASIVSANLNYKFDTHF
ncbi:MAG: hypothetical protein HKL90_00745 [Elusimicrobia bacterium]|nr:hypothetical protein [Elusimicrobiota bacterium]